MTDERWRALKDVTFLTVCASLGATVTVFFDIFEIPTLANIGISKISVNVRISKTYQYFRKSRQSPHICHPRAHTFFVLVLRKSVI